MTTKMTKAQKTTQAAAIKEIARKLNLIAKVMEKTKLAYLFGKGKMLR